MRTQANAYAAKGRTLWGEVVVAGTLAPIPGGGNHGTGEGGPSRRLAAKKPQVVRQEGGA